MPQQYGANMLALNLSRPMYGSPPSYTWAGLPKYKMAGCQMCSGENSVPTWLFHCFDRSILTIDRSPELTAVTPRPSVKNTPDGSTLESRAPTTPVALRPVSARHAPAVVPTPCPQFRKDLRHPQKSSSGRWLRRAKGFSEIGGRETMSPGATTLLAYPSLRGMEAVTSHLQKTK